MMRPDSAGAQGIVLLSLFTPPVYPREFAREFFYIPGFQRVVTANRGLDPGRRRSTNRRMVAGR